MPTVTVITAGETAKAAYQTGKVFTRPEGATYFRYEDLYHAGDTLHQVCQRLTAPGVITLPEGEFEWDNFTNDNKTAYMSGVQINSALGMGIVGSGPNTILRMRAGTSTFASSVPPQSQQPATNPLALVSARSAAHPQEFGQFTLDCTDQGHNYHGLDLFGLKDGSHVYDIKVVGGKGDNGAPPGETFQVSVYGGANHIVERVETDGRFGGTGDAQATVGITVGEAVNVTVRDCNIHHFRSCGFVFYESFNCQLQTTTVDCRGTAPARRTVSSIVNLERTAGCEIHDVTMYNNPSKVHISHSNDSGSLTIDGTSHSWANGSLKVVNPTYNDLWGDGYLYLTAWYPYNAGETNTTAPIVVKADGVTHIPYKWAINTGNVLIS